MKYYGYITDTTRDRTVNNRSFGFKNYISNDRKKLKEALIKKFYERFQESNFIEECADILNGEQQFTDGWCQSYKLICKANFSIQERWQLCMWKIDKDMIIK